MKKRIILSVLFSAILLASCSSNDDETSSQPTVEKLITKVTSKRWQDEHTTNYNPDTFIYENNKLIKAWFYGVSGTLYEFEYGTNGKIAKIYSQYGVDYSDINNSIKSTGEITNQVYDNKNRLITQKDSNGAILVSIEYDTNDKVIKIQDDRDSYLFTDFDSNGNPTKTSIGYTYSYDNKINPTYILFEKYGFFNIEMGNSLDERRVYYISPNNVKEITDTQNNNEIIFSAVYSYGVDNYPTTNNFNSTSGSNHTDTETFTY